MEKELLKNRTTTGANHGTADLDMATLQAICSATRPSKGKGLPALTIIAGVTVSGLIMWACLSPRSPRFEKPEPALSHPTQIPASPVFIERPRVSLTHAPPGPEPAPVLSEDEAPSQSQPSPSTMVRERDLSKASAMIIDNTKPRQHRPTQPTLDSGPAEEGP